MLNKISTGSISGHGRQVQICVNIAFVNHNEFLRTTQGPAWVGGQGHFGPKMGVFFKK